MVERVVQEHRKLSFQFVSLVRSPCKPKLQILSTLQTLQIGKIHKAYPISIGIIESKELS
ncbi:MAG: hypothetical protein H6587_03230 [Flavobacteriales bacterium]|nr:hypothetical protein [Flavobacteriales bacterium]